MSRIIAANEDLQLVLNPDKIYCYSVYSTKNPLFKQELARSMKLTRNVTKFFTKTQIRDAKARLHAIKHVARTFKG